MWGRTQRVTLFQFSVVGYRAVAGPDTEDVEGRMATLLGRRPLSGRQHWLVMCY